MTHSMTGFSTRRGQFGPYSWAWELRSVNGKGLDLRLRVPDWVEGLEAALRADLGRALTRGNVNLTLRLSHDQDGDMGLRLNPQSLRNALTMLAAVEAEALASGVTLATASMADVLSLRGVMEQTSGEEDTKPLLAALIADFAPVLADLQAMRASEGAALGAVILDQLAQIEALTQKAGEEAAQSRLAAPQALRDTLDKVLQAHDGIDETRLAQELALLAVKADVTEELDRLRAHITAARDLMASAAPVGRKLDFLMQEFMREANTLCSKAGALTLTRVGLDLKTVIDQMREQVQNVE